MVATIAIGGEQSGIVFADLATTGDGVLTGLIADLTQRGVGLSTLAAGMARRRKCS
jgi:hypothetical protein